VSFDRALAGGGVAAACCSLAFASYMIGDRDRQPYIPGAEYLAIFAKPSRGIQAPAHPAPALARLESPADANGIDPTPTGSIAAASRADPPDGASPPSVHYRLVAASRDLAWVESEAGFRRVKPGDVLPTLGRVVAIEQRDGRWILLTERAETLELNEASPSEGAPTPDERFSRRMIFGRPAQ
jgi:hypothetical protein